MRVKEKDWDAFLLAVLARMNVTTTASDGRTMLCGTHSLRGGGALALSLAGMPLDVIKKFGRWESDAVHLYVLEAPLIKSSRMISKSLALDWDQAHRGLDPTPAINGIIRVWHVIPEKERAGTGMTGLWMEGICIDCDDHRFTLDFRHDRNLQIGNWNGQMRFPVRGGPTWYKAQGALDGPR